MNIELTVENGQLIVTLYEQDDQGKIYLSSSSIPLKDLKLEED